VAEHKTTNAVSGTDERRNHFLLLVDSDSNSLFYLSMMLQRLNYRITTAGNAEEALAVSAVAEPLLVIVSLDIAGLSGCELIRRFKQNPDTAHIPVIAVRKQEDQAGEKGCLDLGVSACLAYPISAEKLFRAVQTAAEPRPRAHIRIRTLLPVKVNDVPLNGLGGASAVVLSERGIFLPTTRPAPTGTRLSIQIKVKKKRITVDAMVLYSNHLVGGLYQEPGMGIEFCGIEPNDLEYIRLFIRDELTRGIAPLND
jgi:two-component system cell cycle response regulator DivK